MSTATLHEVVLAELRGAIVSGVLPGGTRLVQTDLAARMGVSATPVREAIRDLVTEGLVEFDRYRGAVVHEPTLRELREIYDMRIALETLAIRQVAGRLTAAQVEGAGRLIGAMEASGEFLEFIEHNRRFHELLVEGCGSPRLIATLRTLRDAAAISVGTALGNTPRLMRSSNREHAELLDACVTGDESRAVAVLVRHFQATVDSVLTET